MIKRIGTVVSVARNRARVEFAAAARTVRADLAPSECCRPATDVGGEALEAASSIALHSGDRVEVLVPEPRSLGARLAPLLPVLALPVAGAVVGGIVRGDAGAGIGIGAGLVLGVLAAVLVSRLRVGGVGDKARVLRMVGSGAAVEHCAACAADSARR